MARSQGAVLEVDAEIALAWPIASARSSTRSGGSIAASSRSISSSDAFASPNAFEVCFEAKDSSR